MRISAAAILGLCLANAGTCVVWGSDPGEPLSEVRGRIESTRKTREALQSLRDGLNQQLAEIERRQGHLAHTIAELEAQSRARQKRIDDLKIKCEELQASIRQQQRLLRGQLRSAQVVGRKDWLKLLLNQEDPSRLARVLAYYGYLNQARVNMIQRWRQDLTAVQGMEATLTAESSAQSEARRRTQQERLALQKSSEARRKLLAGWDAELKNQAASLAQLQEDERRLKALIESVGVAPASPEQSTGGGGTPPTVAAVPSGKALGSGGCPPVGPIVARFGSPRLSARWDGILIGGREGEPVRAVASGRVAFADWFRGYGLLLIVDHGDGVLSLYAFNQTLYKAKGEAVVAGEIISAIGVSGGREKPGLYFGIREKGQPVDPVLWCAGRHV
ncbi:MAG: murein hydrolase activator EnvC family protein [Methylococcus sp.]